jgi:tRNA pseudouridine38-40 synthase
MARYFLEVAYKGTRFSGFQIQQNASTIQGEIEKALAILFKSQIKTTGSSRTDAGVHARQNFLHFDTELPLHPQLVYKLNAILPFDIAIKAISEVKNDTHARFSAISRSYQYVIYDKKDPFLQDYGYFFPYTIQFELLEKAADLIKGYADFTSFSKRNTQVKTFNCDILETKWEKLSGQYIFHIKANRFLRGMVRGLVGTMLKVGRENISLQELRDIIESKSCGSADFSVPAKGLFLMAVNYPQTCLPLRHAII